MTRLRRAHTCMTLPDRLTWPSADPYPRRDRYFKNHFTTVPFMDYLDTYSHTLYYTYSHTLYSMNPSSSKEIPVME